MTLALRPLAPSDLPATVAMQCRAMAVLSLARLAGGDLRRRPVAAAEARARAVGVGDFVVRANLNAVPFYQRFGYRVTGSGAMAVAGREVPMAVMEKLAETAA